MFHHLGREGWQVLTFLPKCRRMGKPMLQFYQEAAGKSQEALWIVPRSIYFDGDSVYVSQRLCVIDMVRGSRSNTATAPDAFASHEYTK